MENVISPLEVVGRDVNKTSEKYVYINTGEIVRRFEDAGFSIRQVRKQGKNPHGKHLVRMQSQALINDDHRRSGVVPEAIIWSAHDGSKALWVELGLFRAICANGMVVKNFDMGGLRMRHSGDPEAVQTFVKDAIAKIADDAKRVNEIIRKWSNTYMYEDDIASFTAEAAKIRWPNGNLVNPASLAIVTRDADRDPHLWNVFNRTQEQLIRGANTIRSANGKLRLAPSIRGGGADMTINQKLWELASKYADKKEEVHE